MYLPAGVSRDQCFIHRSRETLSVEWDSSFSLNSLFNNLQAVRRMVIEIGNLWQDDEVLFYDWVPQAKNYY